MDDLLATPFDLSGSFGGWVFTEVGKRRMLLRLGEHDCLLKVPRLLRRRLIGTIHPGEPIRVTGIEEKDRASGLLKRVVSRVVPGVTTFSPAPAISCVVRVCSKKNCWRKGGRELYASLARERDALGPGAPVELRQVGCLDRCQQAPNVNVGDHEYSLCPAEDAGAILMRAVGKA